MNNQDKNRRPIKARQTNWATKCSRYLQQKGATPNGISVFSIIFALLASLLLFFALSYSHGLLRSFLLIFGALMIQGRLICNLLDGMVAVEGGMKSPVGAVYNELPDRIADTLIILGVGYGLSADFSMAITLGWVGAFCGHDRLCSSIRWKLWIRSTLYRPHGETTSNGFTHFGCCY